MKNIIITEAQYNALVGKPMQIEFDPVQVNDYQFQMKTTINGTPYSVEDINFLIEPHELGDFTLYQPHLHISSRLQHQGLGYALYLAFIHEFGNLYSSHWCRTNQNEIPAIYAKLNNEPDITVTNNKKYYLATLDK